MNKPPDSARDLEKQAMAAYEKSNWGLATLLFTQARDAFGDAGDELKSAEMSNNLCVALLQENRPEDAIAAVEGTWEVFHSIGDDLRAAQAHGNLAAAQEACGDFDSAEKAYGKAARLLEKAGDEEARAQTMTALSRLQLKRGKPLQAVSSMQSGLGGSSRLSIGKRFFRWVLSLPGRILKR